MNSGLAMAQLAVLAGAMFAVIGAVLCAVAYPLSRRRVLSLRPIQRTRVLIAWSLAPLGLSGMLTLLYVLPLGLSPRGGCMGEGHTHFCVAHPHLILDEHLLWAVYLLLALLMVCALGMQLYGWWRTRCLLDSLATVSHYDGQRDIQVMDCAAPLALTAGLSRPEVYISSSLLASLPADMLEVIVAHERAHVRRRDGLIQFVAHLSSLLHCPWVRRRLLADLSLACEQACDQEAAREVGDPLRVAETLVALARWFTPVKCVPVVGALSFGSGDLVPRIEALLSTAPTPHGGPLPRQVRG
ncbi:MAG: M56 family metallopeptidase, partial [Chloroflexi bacterium]|nr:M56 family metallopeptidase [Chloroflexota bacterium]